MSNCSFKLLWLKYIEYNLNDILLFYLHIRCFKLHDMNIEPYGFLTQTILNTKLK